MSGDGGKPVRRILRLLRPGPERGAEWEIRHHLEERVDRLVEEGWDPAQARAEAERRFGDVGRVRRELVAMGRTDEGRRRVMSAFETTVQDIRYALRNVRRQPLFAVTLILTLALGIGGSAAIFTVLDALLLRPLPYDDPERIVELGLALDDGITLPFVYWDQVDDWRERGDFLTEMAFYDGAAVVRTDGDLPENLRALVVSHDLDDFLGVRPALGRAFTAADAAPGGPSTALLTHPYWERLGRPAGVVGMELRLDAGTYTVVGVLPPSFKFPVAGSAELWLPVRSDGTGAGRPLRRASVVGRIPEGLSLEAAQARADRVAAALAEDQPTESGWNVTLGPITRWRANRDVRRAVWMFAGAVGGMLLIALVNGVNLLLVRSAARARELGVRRAIGASRGRLVRQLVTESLVVALVAGVVAVALALGGVGALRGVMPSEFAFSSVYEFSVGPRPLLFTFLVSVGAGTVLGMLPALRTGREGRLLPGRPGARPGRGGRPGPRNLLVILETAVSVTLLAGAGLLANSFARLARTDPGFDPEGLVMMEIGLSEARYTSGVERAAFLREVEARVEAIPGIEGATVADGLPTSSGFSFGVSLEAEGRPAPSEGQPFLVPTVSVSPDYLEVMGMPLQAGRNLRPGDAEGRNALIDEALAAYLWPGESPLGRRFRISEDGAWQTVVGVVADQKMMGLDDRQGRFEIFHALSDERVRSHMALAVRTAGDGEAVVQALRRAVQELDPQQPVREIVTARAALAESIAKPRFLLTVMGFLAGTAVVLTAVGLYGVLSYVVARQRRDMGIRIALGATRGRVRGRVLGRGMALAGAGTLLGLGAALALDRLIQSLLFGVEPGDPATMVVVAGLVLGVSSLACYLPARRATRVDPVEVLAAD